jgi:hypothetical protein
MDMRRQARIVYQGKVNLITAGRDRGVVARVQNLSLRGVFMTTPGTETIPAGSEVRCGFTIGREKRTFRGRVAWVRGASKQAPLKSPGVGIEFIDLSASDTELLETLVAPGNAPEQAVDVWFDGLDTPVRCQATVNGQDVRLSTTLPFMRLSAPVRLSFTEGAAVGAPREATLEAVVFEDAESDGVPRLRLNVSLAQLDNARGTIDIKPIGNGSSTEPLPKIPSTLVDPSVTFAPPPKWLALFQEKTDPHPVVTSTAPFPLDLLDLGDIGQPADSAPSPAAVALTAPTEPAKPALRRITPAYGMPVIAGSSAAAPGPPPGGARITSTLTGVFASGGAGTEFSRSLPSPSIRPKPAAWVTRGWRPLVLGGVAGAALVSAIVAFLPNPPPVSSLQPSARSEASGTLEASETPQASSLGAQPTAASGPTVEPLAPRPQVAPVRSGPKAPD